MLFAKSSLSSSTHDREIEREILVDRVNYARISSYCALVVTGISSVSDFVGIILVINGQITIGVLASICGFLANNRFEKIATAANHRLDRMMKDD
ncbi:TRADD-N-associated membrane domain-containing protein [Chamaesiphon minutus]|uniref:Cyanobacterial TRADD-N associated 2 transmembrane domain-containing protein n=1 Tax=Chamaesiphon minutus (strain ATCC 27169 / PCC 6605) TaxID=1173020 RepID=K9UPN9_CHAP6|nr:hypothetical protein [Chamaesiphon minutus]AFY97057.1 hypothetical protein Cha6605_6230 [Chamaesiphon minutus PCC 6605]